MVNKITTPPTQNEVINKINELVDDKQDTLVSGTNIKTINNNSLLGSGNIDIQGGGSITIDSALSTTSTNPVQNKVITSALNGKLDGFTLRFAGNWSGGVHAVNFVTIDYSECNSENGVFIKFSMVNSHGNGQAGRFLQDVVLNVKYTGEVAGTLYRYFAVPIDQASSEYYGSHSYGDVFWVNDTTNKVVRFYVLMHQYSYTSQSPYFRLNASTKGVITQSTGGTGASEYSSGTRVWTTVNWFETDQTYSATSPKPQSGVAIAGALNSYVPTSRTVNGKALSSNISLSASDIGALPSSTVIPTVNNATLTIQKNGSNVATFTANASSNVTANIEVPTTTSSVTSGSSAALTSGGAYTNLVRRLSTSVATGSASQGVYVDANGQVQTCTAVTSTYAATGTAPVNGTAVSNAIAVKQDTLVSGTNIKTINGNSLLGSGNITIETSSTPNVDGETISYNSSDALQTIAVKNVRDGSTLPIWHGTEYQWNHSDPTIWYYWQTSVTALWTASTLPSSAYWYSVTYGDGKFVAAVQGSDQAAYSTDGINWTASTLPSSAYWYSVTYGDGKFVAVAYNSDKSAYSTDGINWTASTLPSFAQWYSVTYGDGKFVAVAHDSDKSAYSTDGINWTASTLPSSTYWTSVAYGNSKFVAVARSSDASAIFTIQYDKCYTDTANPTTASVVYSAPETASSYTISSVTSGAITLSNNNTYYYNQSGNVSTYQTIGDAHPEYLCFIDGVRVKIGNTTIATNNSNNS